MRTAHYLLNGGISKSISLLFLFKLCNCTPLTSLASLFRKMQFLAKKTSVARLCCLFSHRPKFHLSLSLTLKTRYSQTADFLSDNAMLDAAHWSTEHEAFLDFGLHTEQVKLERPRRRHPNDPKPDKERVVLKEPKLQFVNQQGYVGKLN